MICSRYYSGWSQHCISRCGFIHLYSASVCMASRSGIWASSRGPVRCVRSPSLSSLFNLTPGALRRMYIASFTNLSWWLEAIHKIFTPFQSILCPSCHTCSATTDLSNLGYLQAERCSLFFRSLQCSGRHGHSSSCRSLSLVFFRTDYLSTVCPSLQCTVGE